MAKWNREREKEREGGVRERGRNGRKRKEGRERVRAFTGICRTHSGIFCAHFEGQLQRKLLLLRRLAYLEQHIDPCLYARYHRKVLVINSVFDFEPKTAEYHTPKVGEAVFCLFSGFRNCKISAHLVR